MRRFIELGYRGTSFHGWQRQPKEVSVQQTLEEALARVTGREIAVTGAGRTDTGVHARQMFTHFDVEDPLRISDERLAAALNTMCGRDITVKRIFRVSDDLHARFSAIARTYRYFIHYGKDPFLNGLSLQMSTPLDINAMNLAAELLKETTDFTSFAKLGGNAKTNICDVSKALWTPHTFVTGTPGLMFEITANRFLRNMVRAITGTLIEVGSGKCSMQEFQNVVEARDRCAAGSSMPAHALYLWSIKYPSDPPFFE